MSLSLKVCQQFTHLYRRGLSSQCVLCVAALGRCKCVLCVAAAWALFARLQCFDLQVFGSSELVSSIRTVPGIRLRRLVIGRSVRLESRFSFAKIGYLQGAVEPGHGEF